MRRYLLSRVAGGIGTLAGGSVVAFFVFHLLPGNPAEIIAGTHASAAQVAAIQREFALNQSLVAEFVGWWEHVLQGNLGVSVVSNVPVSHLLAQTLPVTLTLIGASTVVALAFTLVLSLGGLRKGSVLDRIALGWSVVGLSIPTFWLGILAILLFAIHWGWLPAGGYISPYSSPLAGLKSLALPAITFGIYMSAIFTQFLRRSFLDVMREDFVRTARARGLREWQVVARHASKPAMIPFVTVVGIAVSTSLGFAMVVETVFAYPGFGSLFVQAITTRDYYVVQAGIMVIVAAVVVANILVDVAYLFLDPRIRYGREG
ncbi:MAG: peptide transporter [Acidimicrobiaceae bacterium]|nr:peptide transporter [Acidimicrobiaceae bacterium]